MNLPPETCIKVSRSLGGFAATEGIPVAELGEIPVRVTARYIEPTGLDYPPASEIGEAVADLAARVASRESAWPGTSAEVRLVAAIDGHFMYALTPAEEAALRVSAASSP